MLPLLALLAASPGDVVDRVAATVDGEVVTLSELEDRAGSAYARAEKLPPGKERDEARSEALRRAFDQIVAEKLLQKQARVLQLDVTEQQVDAAVEDIKTRNHFSDEELDRALGEQGLDRAAFRAQVRRELETYQVMQAKVRGRVKVSDEDLKNYYQTHPQEFGGEEEIHARHIFLPLAEGASPADEAKVRAQGEKALRRREIVRRREGRDQEPPPRGAGGPDASSSPGRAAQGRGHRREDPGAARLAPPRAAAPACARPSPASR